MLVINFSFNLQIDMWNYKIAFIAIFSAKMAFRLKDVSYK